MRPRLSYTLVGMAAGVALMLTGIFLPGGWYDRLPEPLDDLPEPAVSGLTLVRLCFAFEGAIVLSAGLWGGFRSRSSASERSVSPSVIGVREPPGVREGGLALLAIVAIGAALRLYDLGSELWLDEITTVLIHRNVPVLHLVAFRSINNHLANTLLVKAVVGLWGSTEWVIRLPAAVFGIASIPVAYLLARWIVTRRHALIAALLLAVSYHHVFFSQNARGYTAYLLWSMLGVHYLLKGLTRNRVRDWALYVLVMWLAVTAVLIGFFTIAAHVLTVGVAVWMPWRRGNPIAAIVRRAAAAWLVLWLLSFHVYATVVPTMWVALQAMYRTEAAGYAPFSQEHLAELARGISQGFGPAAVAGAVVVMMVFAVAAAHALWRRPTYTTAMLAPLAVTSLFLLATGSQFAPRFFVWVVPVAFILAVDSAAWLADTIRARSPSAGNGRRGRFALMDRTPEGVAAGLVLLSLWSLVSYYGTPKQPSRTAVEWVHQQSAEGDVVVAAYLAKAAFMFYGPAYGLREDDDFYIVHRRDELQAIETSRGGRTIRVVTTFPRALRLDHPDLYQRIMEGYRPVRSFPATVGDGGFTIWTSKSGR